MVLSVGSVTVYGLWYYICVGVLGMCGVLCMGTMCG